MAADIVFKFCVSDSYQDVSNCMYPHHAEVRSADDFIEMAKHDHVCASYKNNYRSKENFLESNVHGYDIDNDHTEAPKEWLTDKDLVKMFAGNSMIITESRNHMKWKGKYSPRPRYHIFFMASKLCVDASQFMSRDDWNRMQKAVEKIAAYASPIEDEMFREYPELSDEYVDVFYGATTNEPRGSVDANIVERAKKFCEQLF